MRAFFSRLAHRLRLLFTRPREPAPAPPPWLRDEVVCAASEPAEQEIDDRRLYCPSRTRSGRLSVFFRRLTWIGVVGPPQPVVTAKYVAVDGHRRPTVQSPASRRDASGRLPTIRVPAGDYGSCPLEPRESSAPREVIDVHAAETQPKKFKIE